MSDQHDQTHEPWTIGRLLKSTTDFLRHKGVAEPRLCAEILLAHTLKYPRIRLYTRFDEICSPEQLDRYRELVRSAARHTPVAYLVGNKEFFSLSFEVTPDVLIPRPETECLVEHAVELVRRRDDNRVHILDLGTGSGCIIVTIATQLSNVRGTGTDVSAAVLDIARRNADRHRVSDRVTFVEADRLALPREVVPGGGFDMMVCNPPYVAQADMPALPPNVRDHEPHSALTPGTDGLDFYRSIAAQGHGLLRSKGHILVEIGAGQGSDVRSIFASTERFRHQGTYRSQNDPHDRVLHFTKV
ncbi:MAG: peptide chain release factor N(5)-glutamine methyltransferase [Phycisphaerae bacterium]